MFECILDKAHAGEPFSGPVMDPPPAFWSVIRICMADKQGLKQVVVSKPKTLVIERHDKQVSFVHLSNQSAAVVSFRQETVAKGSAETIQYGGHGKKFKDFRWLMGNDLVHQEIDDQSVITREIPGKRFGVLGVEHGKPGKQKAPDPPSVLA